jgi:hypothetical protein
MKKISAEKYVEGVDSIYVEQPGYRTGGDGSDGTCDCIGMCRGGSEREGVTDIKNFRGTNQAARKTIEDLKPIRSVNELELGCVVLKTRDKDDKNMPLPDKYRKGGSEYDPVWGETNFTHIGTVTRLHPLEITHMTSPTAKKDSSLGNWKYSGWLPWVTREGSSGEDPDDEPETEWATVVAESGSTVKMRAKPSTSCRLYWDVPVGSQVMIEEAGTPWTKITWAGQTGYMMTKFLLFGDETIKDRYTVTITGLTKDQAEEICRQWGNAKMEKG